MNKDQEEIKRLKEIIVRAAASIYCKGHDTPEEWEALKILREGM